MTAGIAFPEIFFELLRIAAELMLQRDEKEFSGICQFKVREDDRTRWICVEGQAGRYTISRRRAAEPDLLVELSAATAEAIAAKDLDHYDHRDPRHADQVSFSGDASLFRVLARHFFGVKWIRETQAFEIRDIAAHWNKAALVTSGRANLAVRRVSCRFCFNIDRPLFDHEPVILASPSSCCRKDVREPAAIGVFLNRLANFAATGSDPAIDKLGVTIERFVEDAVARSTTALLLPKAVEEDLAIQFSATALRWIPPLVWLGRAGQVTGLHRDPYHNLNTSIIGTKLWTLFAPHEAHKLYPRHKYPGYQPCSVDPLAPDLSTYPEFSGASALSEMVRPGETILLPCGWFHHVSIVDPVTLSIGSGALP